jgi:ABC-2 type transport system permease protein
MKLSLTRPYLRVIVIAAEMALKMAAADAFIIFGVLFQPLIIALLGMWMLQGRGGDYAIFVVIGSGMTGLWSSLLFVSGNSITQERWVGTLEMMAGLPTPLQVIVFGKNIANVLQSLLSMIASYALVAIFFGYSLTIAQPVLFFISLVFTVISFVCFGLMIAPVFVLNPDVQRWQNGLEYPVYILGGFLFPIALLPGWTTPVSYVLAPYWAARALHATSSGGGDFGEVALCWGMMLLFSAISVGVSGRLFKVMMRRARIAATLGVQ